jgi:hypothetical protein
VRDVLRENLWERLQSRSPSHEAAHTIATEVAPTREHRAQGLLWTQSGVCFYSFEANTR